MKYTLLLDEERYIHGIQHTGTSTDIYELDIAAMNIGYMDCYKVINDEVVFDEIKYQHLKYDEEEAKKKPTFEERIEAQVLYTALMTDTMLEEEEQ